MEKDPETTGKRQSYWEVKLFGVNINLLWALIYFLVVSWLWSQSFALLIMGALLFHEYGHAWSMWRNGVRIKGMYFMPPLGLAVVSDSPLPSRTAEAEIGIMGPLWGLVMTLAFWAVGMATGSLLVQRMTAFVAFINLFNLVPLNPLDGGRIVKSVAYSFSPKLGLGVLVAGLYLTVGLTVFYSPLVGILVLFMGYQELRQEIHNRQMASDRKRIIDALAEFLDKVSFWKVGVPTPRTAEAVVDGLEKYYAGLASATPEHKERRMAEFLAVSPEMARQLMAHGHDYVDYCYAMPMLIAREAVPSRRRQRGGVEDVIAAWAIGPRGTPFVTSAMAKFLNAREVPLMSARPRVLYGVGYLALVAVLYYLWQANGGMPGMLKLLEMLK